MKISNEFKIGFWAIVAIVVMFYGIRYLKGINSFKEGQFYYLSCDKVNGLAVSSHVTLHGLKVGMVRSMEYDHDTKNIMVLLNIYDSDLKIPTDSRIYIQGDLLGTSEVVLDMGESSTTYQPWDTIQAPDAAAGLLEKADPIIENVNNLMPKLDSLIAGINVLVNESKMQESLLQINTLTQHLNSTVSQLNTLLRKDVPGIMNNLESATANLDTISVQAKEADIKQLLTNTNATIESANQLLKQMQDENGTVGKILSTSELHDQLNKTIADVDSLINDIKANPKKYIHIKVF